MSWREWKGGVQEAYRWLGELEKRLETGDELTEDEQKWLPRLRSITEKYTPTGRKRRALPANTSLEAGKAPAGRRKSVNCWQY